MFEGEEDEKQSVSAAAAYNQEGASTKSYYGTFIYDERVVSSLKRIIEYRSEELLKALPLSFLDHVVASYTLTGVYFHIINIHCLDTKSEAIFKRRQLPLIVTQAYIFWFPRCRLHQIGKLNNDKHL